MFLAGGHELRSPVSASRNSPRNAPPMSALARGPETSERDGETESGRPPRLPWERDLLPPVGWSCKADDAANDEASARADRDRDHEPEHTLVLAAAGVLESPEGKTGQSPDHES